MGWVWVPLASVQVKAHSRSHRLEAKTHGIESAVLETKKKPIANSLYPWEQSSLQWGISTRCSASPLSFPMQLLRVSTLDRNSPITARRWAQRIWGFGFERVGEISPQDCSSYDEETLRWQLSPSTLCFLWLLPEVSPCAGIPLSVILFSPRSLLPGQMHTNAFRSSTDKEWTRFRGSNVSGHLVKYYADVRLSMRICATEAVPGTGFHLTWQLGDLFLFRFFGVFPWQGRQLTKQVPAAGLQDFATKTWQKLVGILESLGLRPLNYVAGFVFSSAWSDLIFFSCA